MSNGEDDTTKENANNSLSLVREMKLAGLRRASYPKWFLAVIAILIFLSFTKPLGLPDGTYVAMGLLFYLAVRKRLGVIPIKDKKREWKLVGGIFVAASLYLVVAYLSRELRLIWIPYVAGAVVAAAYYWIQSKAPRISDSLNQSINNEE